MHPQLSVKAALFQNKSFYNVQTLYLSKCFNFCILKNCLNEMRSDGDFVCMFESEIFTVVSLLLFFLSVLSSRYTETFINFIKLASIYYWQQWGLEQYTTSTCLVYKGVCSKQEQCLTNIKMFIRPAYTNTCQVRRTTHLIIKVVLKKDIKFKKKE